MIAPTMWGQWVGELNDGNRQWHAVLNIDQDRSYFGRLLLFNIADSTEWRHATLKNILVVNARFSADTEFSPYPFDEQRDDFRSILFGTIVGNFVNNSGLCELHATLETPNEPTGSKSKIVIRHLETDEPTQPDFDFTWSQFKEWVSNFSNHSCPYIFRGHESTSYRLRTSLHRTGRRDLIRYREENIPLLAAHVSGINGRTYQMNDFHDYNNLLSLAQHHGYPTPLLDWTESPYIAAWFSLRGASSNGEGKCRIYTFDIDQFQADVSAQAGALEVPILSLYACRAAIRDHSRAVPQQSVFMLSNVAEIEVFIALMEEQVGKRYLTKIDLTKAEARTALAELRMMGITEATMFPGLDGICHELRDRFFNSCKMEEFCGNVRVLPPCGDETPKG
jgi:hypothetical protein